MEAERRDVQMCAAQFLSLFPKQLLWNKTTDAFLATLAWDEKISLPYARMALVLWLSQWAAIKRDSTLAANGFTLDGDFIRPYPLSEREWEGRLKKSKATLSCPGFLGKVAAAALRDTSDTPGPDEEWFTLISVGAGKYPSDFLKSLEGFLAVPDDAVFNISLGLKSLIQTMELGANTSNIMASVTNAVSLAAAAKAVPRVPA